jgi:hypothetical protein
MPKELILWIQNPVITWWWTIGKVLFSGKALGSSSQDGQVHNNILMTSTAKNKIASGLYSLMQPNTFL